MQMLLHYIKRSFNLWQSKNSSFGINFCSYLKGSFQNSLEQILTRGFWKVGLLKLVWSFSLFTH